MKLIIRYSKVGKIVPDLAVTEWLEELMEQIANTPPEVNTISIEIGGEVMINAVRLAIKQERLNCEDVTIQFLDMEWQFEKNGRCLRWPDGFCDTNVFLLEHLLGWDGDGIK